MYRRRVSPYSQIDELRQSRAELLVLVLGTVFLGVVLNILASILYQFFDVDGASMDRLLVLALAGVVVALLLVGLIILAYYGHRETAACRLEVALPYLLDGRQIQMPRQRRHYPKYRPVVLGTQRFVEACGPRKPGADQLTEAWYKSWSAGADLTDVLGPWHRQLVDCLVLEALHRYCRTSLGRSARFGWRRVSLDAQRVSLSTLTEQFGQNVFLNVVRDCGSDWIMLLPAGVRFTAAEDAEGTVWSLHRARFGEINLRCHREQRIAGPNYHIARILGASVPTNKKDKLRVISSHIEVRLTSRWTFLPFGDAFHEWAAGLLAFLEEELDWDYFEQSLPDRLITNVLWKLADAPEGASYWQKLEAIEERLIEPSASLPPGEPSAAPTPP
jgi:hypothetical protein